MFCAATAVCYNGFKRPLQKVTNYCKMINLAANCLKLIDVSSLIRLLRFSQFSLKFIIFRYVTDFRKGLPVLFLNRFFHEKMYFSAGFSGGFGGDDSGVCGSYGGGDCGNELLYGRSLFWGVE